MKTHAVVVTCNGTIQNIICVNKKGMYWQKLGLKDFRNINFNSVV